MFLFKISLSLGSYLDLNNVIMAGMIARSRSSTDSVFTPKITVQKKYYYSHTRYCPLIKPIFMTLFVCLLHGVCSGCCYPDYVDKFLLNRLDTC